MSSLTLTDWLNSINQSKQYLFSKEEEEKYPSFVINKCLSYFPDTVLLVNEINTDSFSNEMQYDFLINTIERRKRFSKWNKKNFDKQKDIENISKFLKCSTSDSEFVFLNSSEADLLELRKIYESIEIDGGTKLK